MVVNQWQNIHGTSEVLWIGDIAGRALERAGKTDQTACKPGSVPLRPGQRLRRNAAAIPLDPTSLWGSRDLPGRLGPATALPWREPRRAVPIWSCSWRGLPCRPRCRVRGALLPHPFTLARLRRGSGGRFAFCGAVPGLAPGGRYPPPCRRGARTFLDPPWPRLRRTATARPSDPERKVGFAGVLVKAPPPASDAPAARGSLRLRRRPRVRDANDAGKR